MKESRNKKGTLSLMAVGGEGKAWSKQTLYGRLIVEDHETQGQPELETLPPCTFKRLCVHLAGVY